MKYWVKPHSADRAFHQDEASTTNKLSFVTERWGGPAVRYWLSAQSISGIGYDVAVDLSYEDILQCLALFSQLIKQPER